MLITGGEATTFPFYVETFCGRIVTFISKDAFKSLRPSTEAITVNVVTIGLPQKALVFTVTNASLLVFAIDS